MKAANTILKGLFVALLLVGFTGCDFLEDMVGNEKEVEGTVESIGDASLTVDGIAYTVTSKTEFEGDLTGLGDLSVGDEVEIEYEEKSGAREALEVELAGADDDDDSGGNN